jgi:tetraacyldisaccharide 4'-kinase
MKLSTPRWWYARDGRSGRVLRTLLKPVSWIWSWATARRIAAGQPVDPGIPVICVGNVTVGGVGKTPIVRELLVQLTRHGLKAHGLSRGHGGRLKGPVQVDPDLHTAADVGDEPLMLAQDFPVWVAADRAAGVKAAADAGAQVVVMDDGHQNPSVRKSLSLVVVDGETRDGEWPFGDGAVFPSGPMREPLDQGLARADAVVVLMPGNAGAPSAELLAQFGGKPVLVARLEPAAAPPPGPQLAFAGVGKPWKVERALREAGLALVDFASFPDHARYDERTLEFLAAHARTHGAGLVTTEKDWVRLSPDWRTRIKAWPVRARFEDQKGLDQLLGFEKKPSRKPRP